MRNLFLLCAVLQLASCAPKMHAPYAVAHHETYAQYQTEGARERFILIEDDFSIELHQALLDLDHKGNFSSLSTRQNRFFQPHLNFISSEKERLFLSGVVYLKRDEYLLASQHFNRCFEEYGLPQAGLLYAESLKLAREDSELVSSVDTYPIYQKAYDNCENGILAELIRKRFKLHQSGL